MKILDLHSYASFQMVLESWAQVLMRAGQALYQLSRPQPPFAEAA